MVVRPENHEKGCRIRLGSTAFFLALCFVSEMRGPLKKQRFNLPNPVKTPRWMNLFGVLEE